jgi:hypothetical protein
MIHRRTIRLTIKGPILTRSNTVGSFGIDAPFARTPDNRFYIPGTLVIGRLAEAFRQFHAACHPDGDHSFGHALTQFFGGGNDTLPGDENTGRANRRRLFIGDLKTEHRGSEGGTRTRIAIDGATGSVAQGMLQVIEAPFAPGEEIVFEGELRLIASAEEAKIFIPQVSKALRWVTQWGALRGLGYGEAHASCMLEEVKSFPPPVAPTETPSRIRLCWTFHDPICVGEQKTDANTFQSSDVIPGGVLKGALANQLIRGIAGAKDVFLSDLVEKFPDGLKPLAKAFNELRFTHAFPVPKNGKQQRPNRIQHSWVPAGDKLIDLAFAENPRRAVLVDGMAPLFSPDWKDSVWSMAKAKSGWTDVGHDFRIRTAIDHKNRAAEAERLFAISYRRTDEHDWISDIDLSDVAEEARKAVIDCLCRSLEGGLAGIGRGGAFATVTPLDAEGSSSDPQPGRVVISLQTPALFRRPEPDATGDVTEGYAQAWKELCPEGVELEAVFVRERLSGAEFILITEPGSIFVLRVAENGLEAIKGWLKTGLGIPETTLAFYELDKDETRRALWRYCPFVNDNGYGEIALVPSPAEHEIEQMQRAVKAVVDSFDVADA